MIPLFVSPEFIDFDRESKKFIAHVDIEQPFNPSVKKYLFFHARVNPDSIPYKKYYREKINPKHLELVLLYYLKMFKNVLKIISLFMVLIKIGHENTVLIISKFLNNGSKR